MEDTAKLPLMDDASSYSEQFTITGLSCLSARLASCMPSASNIRNGVFLKNVPTENKQRFGTRVLYSRIIKAKTMIKGKGCNHYVSLRNKDVEIHNNPKLITEVFSSLLVHAILEQVVILFKIKLSFSRKKYLQSCYSDYVACRKVNFKCKLPLTICDKVMNGYDNRASFKNILYNVITDNIQLKLRDMFLMIKRKFKGNNRSVARFV